MKLIAARYDGMMILIVNNSSGESVNFGKSRNM